MVDGVRIVLKWSFQLILNGENRFQVVTRVNVLGEQCVSSAVRCCLANKGRLFFRNHVCFA